jgi:hypothetical protein
MKYSIIAFAVAAGAAIVYLTYAPRPALVPPPLVRFTASGLNLGLITTPISFSQIVQYQ